MRYNTMTERLRNYDYLRKFKWYKSIANNYNISGSLFSGICYLETISYSSTLSDWCYNNHLENKSTDYCLLGFRLIRGGI